MSGEKAELIGTSIGHIRIVDTLGHGGMGTVYVGEDEKLQRKVAVKAIRGEHRLHREAKARFLREARILSQLNHRNICVVHDFIEAGDSDFLVLELVPGTSLRAAMEKGLPHQNKLDIARQLLEVLVAVHGQGVIHRDLKPENIMVKPGGEIAVLDFGLARSIVEDVTMLSEAATMEPAGAASHAEIAGSLRIAHGPSSTLVKTDMGTLLGTAGYMSPEQARAEPATAASDMYSVGMILQELFTGSQPFDEDLQGMALVIKTAQGESRPVTGLPADLTALIERLKAFAPGARPSSLDALAQLESIIDRPRRRRARAIVAAVWIALAALAGGMTMQSMRASREAERANHEAAAAKDVSDFLVGLFEESNPEQARGASLTAEEILQRGAGRIHEELAGQPLTRARLLMTIGRVYNKMGLYADAIAQVEEVVEIRARELGEGHAEVADALSSLGYYYYLNGEHEQSESQLKRALEIGQRAPDTSPRTLANTHMNLGMLYSTAGRFPESERELQHALEIYETELGADSVEASRCLANLAILTARQGRVAEAEPIFRRALAIQERALGQDHPSVGEAINNLAIALKIQGKYEEAEELYRRNLETQERVLGANHPDLGGYLTNLANLNVVMGRPDDAEPLYVRALEIRRAALGDEHHLVAQAIDNLGALYIDQGRFLEAEQLCLEALAIRERTLGPSHPALAISLSNLAGLYRQTGRTGQAEAMYRRSLAIHRKLHVPEFPERVKVVKELAALLNELGRDDEAEQLQAREAELRSDKAEGDP